MSISAFSATRRRATGSWGCAVRRRSKEQQRSAPSTSNRIDCNCASRVDLTPLCGAYPWDPVTLLFLNFVMKSEVIADITNFVRYANANLAATPLLDLSIPNDTASYPTPAQRERLFVETESTPEHPARSPASGNSSRLGISRETTRSAALKNAEPEEVELRASNEKRCHA